jgi:hypothetical protein
MRKRNLTLITAAALAVVPLGCNDTGHVTRTTKRTTTTTTSQTAEPTATPSSAGPNANVNVDRNGATATGRAAANGREGVDVDTAPGGGVNVDIQGEPIRDRIRERRAARDAAVPR